MRKVVGEASRGSRAQLNAIFHINSEVLDLHSELIGRDLVS